MPYLGNPAQQRFSSPRAASVYSGDGSTVAFTLEEVVSTDEDILVSVDGVIQEPSVAYAVSSGTTLTFTAAPSTNSGNNIFVYYIARTFGSVSMPDGQNVNAATASFSGAVTAASTVAITSDLTVDTSTLKVDSTNNRVGVGTASPSKELDVVGTLQIEKSGQAINLNTPSSSQNSWINLSDNGSAKWEIQKNASNILNIYSYDAGATVMSFDATGAVTKPLQPAFLATKSGAQNNIGLNSVTQITFDGERFDQNGDFSSSTFTAPVTGKYQFNVITTLANIDRTATYIEFKLVTSNVTYTNPIIDPDGFNQDLPYFTISTSYLVDMDANDTAKASLYQPDGAAQMDVRAGQSFFSGYLVA